MEFVLRGGNLFQSGALCSGDLHISGQRIVDHPVASAAGFDCRNLVIFPGFADVHVHLREPGFLYKETIRTGSLAAAHGGYTTVCAMPNLNPAPDSLEHLAAETQIIANDAVISVLPYGTITRGEQGTELSDMEALAPYVVAFSDDGRGVQSGAMMHSAMLQAKALGKLIVAHCEDNALLGGGYIHDGAYARTHGHRGISSASEWVQVTRDLQLAAETGCGYHVCHISTKESVSLIREAKKSGVNVTCETTPHYLLLDDSMLREDGNFKMNPPLRSPEDREALLEGICDGTIDMIATDHAPHSAEEKSRGLAGSLMGIVGLETAFPLLYTNLVRKDVISLARLIELLHTAPCRRFSIPETNLMPGARADFTVFDLETPYEINPNTFLSKGRNTPFAGFPVYGACRMTVSNGQIAWMDAAMQQEEESE